MLVLTFAIGEARYAVDVRRVVEVVPRIGLQPVPGAAGRVVGVFDHAGEVVPVVDLGLWLGAGACEARLSTRIVLVEHAGGTAGACVGLVAERVTELREITDEAVKWRPVEGTARGVLGPICRTEDGLIQLLNVDRLVDAALGAGSEAGMRGGS